MTSLLGALDHGAVKAAILVEIELIHLRCGVRLTQLLKAYRAERRNAEHRAKLSRRGRHRALAFMME